ncbi:hypothetical protein D3C74_91840 [compost metagenome]
MAIGFIKVGNFKNGKHAPVTDTNTVKHHLKYIGFRSREIVPGQERFFNGTDDRADWRKFYEGVKNHKALQHSNTVKVHKLIFSLKEQDYAAYQRSGRDYKDIVRHVIKEYEQRKGVKLEWIASRHDQNSHPHCHVVIRGVTKEGPDGKTKRVYLSKDDVEKMKRDFDNEVARHRQYEREPVPERDRGNGKDIEKKDRGTALDKKFAPELPSKSFMNLFDEFRKSIEREQRKNAREGERERQKKQKGKGR